MHAQNHYDVAVVGAGQAGLTMGYELARQGRRFVILEAADSVGAAWRTRWDSLTLFTPRRYDSLPGLRVPRRPRRLSRPRRDDRLPRELRGDPRPPRAARQRGPRRSGARTAASGSTFKTAQPLRPTRSSSLPGPSRCHACQPSPPTSTRRSFRPTAWATATPGELPDGPVLVVGGGNTGFQIAEELAAERETHLSVGSRQMPLPQRIGGRDLFWWLGKLGILEKSIDTKLGRRLAPGTRSSARARAPAKRAGVTMHGRAVGASGRTVVFEDGSTLDVAAAIWATGYRFDHSWIDLPIMDDDGQAASTAAGSPTFPASTSSAFPGSTRAAPRSSAG